MSAPAGVNAPYEIQRNVEHITHIQFSLLINSRGPGYSVLTRLLAHQHLTGLVFVSWQ